MSIHEPGRRLMHFIPLKFVQKKVSGGGGRSVSAALNLTSMIDFLVTIVVFLLASFSASGEIPLDKNVKLPKAENTIDMVDAPMIAINGSQILVDGTAAGSTRALEEAGRMQRIDELFNILKSKRELWKSIQGGSGKAFPGVCVLQVDQQVQALVVKSVFQTAAFAGYPNVSFMVGQLPKHEH
ncbi:MAG TPA: biopolymer transporter ExbD [Polyangiaceae bacterium]|nr:biopolymer transporter ExbD [Polyangiaceae bacterium]